MLCLVLAPLFALASPIVNHDLDVTLDIKSRRIDVVDRLTLDTARTMVEFTLHAGMKPMIDGAQVEITSLPHGDGAPADLVRAVFQAPTRKLVVTYGGVIDHPPVQLASEHQRSFRDTPGTIADEGVYLSASSRWLPSLHDGSELVTTKVSVRGLPEGWRALCEGDAVRGAPGVQNAWISTTPSDNAHLVAGPFIEVKQRKRGVDVLIWLRAKEGVLPPDGAALAQRYLEVTGQYLELYGDLIGPYPYGKFALVENFWETGWGMASFTLLGSQVIRFPFILHTSWPHELLHNWWGNGVFVQDGNWSEGLTAYLADHLHAEHEGKADEYRRTTLQKYQDFVATNAALDFPLQVFGARSSAASEAVGYGKWLMVLHMLRQKLGDDAFKRALQKLWQEHRFERATFDDVRAALQAQTKEDLAPFFQAWVQRTGAPRIRWSDIRQRTDPDGARRVDVVLEQTQAGEAFPMAVPVVVTTNDGRSIASVVAFTTAKSASTSIPVPAPAVRVDVDPFADTFRALLQGETAPALSRALGAKSALFVLPRLAAQSERDAWQKFARTLCESCRVIDDKDVETLPTDAAIWVLGYANQLRGGIAAASARFGAHFEDRGFLTPGPYTRERLKSERTQPGKTSIVLALPHPLAPALAMTFVGAHDSSAIASLARKIPHYGKYGYLAFSGDRVENSLKGQWQPDASPLTVFLGATRPALALKSGAALAPLPPPFDADRMLADVRALAQLQGRGRGSKNLDKALDLVKESLKTTLPEVSLACDVAVLPAVCNVVATLPGKDRTQPAVVLGAHVDHLGTVSGKVHPGADDNASGVAVVLEVARALAKQGPFLRDVVVVAFSGDEAGLLGSRAFVRALADGGAAATGRVHSMVNLDTVGRRGKRPLLILDGDSATEWVHIARGIGFTTGVPSQLAKDGGGASDQQAFIEAGIPAVQIFSGPHADYHRSGDTADKVEARSLVDAAVLAREMVAYLADRKEPLTAKGATAGGAVSAGPRRASLGTVPDMAFPGPGVRLEDVVAGSPAAGAGLRTGDVLVRFDGAAVEDLRGYSDLLKAKQPGEKASIVIVRDGKELALDVTLVER